MNTNTARLEKLAVILLGVIASSLLCIAGCLLSLAFTYSCAANCVPQAVIAAASQPRVAVTPVVLPAQPIKKHKKHKLAPVVKTPIAVASSPPVEKAELPLPSEAQPPEEKRYWVYYRAPQAPLESASCQPTEQQIRHFLSLGKTTNMTFEEVMTDEGLKNLICQLYKQSCPDDNCLTQPPTSSPQ